MVKSKKAEDHTKDLDKIFRVIKKYKVKLNQVTHVFRVLVGKFIRFIVSYRGIKANPKKIKTILDMQPSRPIKEV